MKRLNLQLQPLSNEHLSQMLELDQATFGGLWTLLSYQHELDSPNSTFIGLVAPVFTPKLLGMGCMWSILEEAHITILAVHPQYHGQGFGQAVLWGLLQTAQQIGLERATLEVRVSNLPAISLYQKFGFTIAGRRKRYYQDTGEDALILWRGDLQHPNFDGTLAEWHTHINQRLSKNGWNLTIVDAWAEINSC